MAYLELKRLERVLQDKIDARRKSESGQGQMSIGFVTPQQFYGMDTNEFAVELARVTLMIARKVAIDLCDIHDQPALPLDTLDENIVCKDALFTEWVKADAIIGNPPFLGGTRIRSELGDEYTDRVFARFSNIHAQVDFASYWFRLAHETIGENGRAGLVATNSISQGKSRSVSLDYIMQNDGYIHEAVSTQVWSGEAKVHVSIVNWSKQELKNNYLDNVLVSQINSSLKSTIDVAHAVKIKANLGKSFVGVQPNSKGFLVDEDQAQKWIKADPHNQQVLKLFSMGSDLAQSPHGKPDRWIIDFSNMPIEDASEYKLPFEHVKKYVKPEREQNREAVLREKWWRFKRTNEALRNAVSSLSEYLAVPRVSKWNIFLPFQSHQG